MQASQLSLESFYFGQLLGLQGLVGFSDFADLRLVLLLEHLHGGGLVLVLLVLQNGAPLLNLLQRQLKLALAVSQVSLVVFFLLLQEHYFPLPQSFVPVVVRLKVLQLALTLLQLSLQAQHVLSLGTPEIEGLARRLVHVLQLGFKGSHFLGVELGSCFLVSQHLSQLLFEPLAAPLQLRSLFVETALNLFERPSLLVILGLPQFLFRGDSVHLGLGVIKYFLTILLYKRDRSLQTNFTY